MRKRKQDFSDIDNLDRATESFLRAQRKALRAPSVDRSELWHGVKRGLMCFVLGAMFMTALIGGIRLGTRGDAALRQPDSEAATTPTTTAAPATEDSPAETTQEADDTVHAALTAPPPQMASTMTDATDGEPMGTAVDPITPTLPPASTLSIPPPQSSPGMVSTVYPTTTSHPTARDTVTTRVTTTRATTPRVTTTRTTTTRPTTTRTTTTPRVTTTRTTTTTRATTTRITTTTRATTTTEAPRAAVRCVSVRVLSSSWNGTAYVQTIGIQFYNGGTGESSAFGFDLRCSLANGRFLRVSSTDTATCSVVSYGTPDISLQLNRSIDANMYCSVTLNVQSSAPITGVSYLG